jgi:hypothetical protein
MDRGERGTAHLRGARAESVRRAKGLRRRLVFRTPFPPVWSHNSAPDLTLAATRPELIGNLVGDLTDAAACICQPYRVLIEFGAAESEAVSPEAIACVVEMLARQLIHADIPTR